jgi:serine/threonine-protein kinase HipA
MRRVKVFVHGIEAGLLEEISKGEKYRFSYLEEYRGLPVSLTMPTSERVFEFISFPPFFDGLLPEGVQLEGLLRQRKIDQHDYLKQLIAVGSDMVGAVTVEDASDE